MASRGRELASAREHAAAELEAAIAALGVAYAAYEHTTQQLGDLVGLDLGRRLETPICLHLVRAGLAPFLASKLEPHGPLAPLAVLAAEQHQTLRKE